MLREAVRRETAALGPHPQFTQDIRVQSVRHSENPPEDALAGCRLAPFS